MDVFSMPIVTVTISLVICWALFAIFCSTINEAVSLMKAERGRFMKKWLLKQLFDHPNGVNWGSLLYMHGSIDLLNRATSTPTNNIESRLFAETLIEVVGNSQIVQMNKPSELPFSSRLLNNFKAATLTLKPSDVVSFFQKAMHSAEMCKNASGNADETAIYNCLVNQIESWYNEMGERLTYWYRKRARVRLFWLGILLAILFNIDSVQLFNHLQTNKSSQAALMNFYESNTDRLNTLARANNTLDKDSLKDKIVSYGNLMDSLALEANLPVGWSHSILNKHKRQDKNSANQAQLQSVKSSSWIDKLSVFLFAILFPKLLGFALSGLAASFGAPFWFDLLKKIYSRKTNKA
ncbi:hypothetical protein CNR22_18385 [Sphingobacteriaceae bacterium]|nr:hypothetical protein CNR22_18385 [Sphingobacteriaceae bacterium]